MACTAAGGWSGRIERQPTDREWAPNKYAPGESVQVWSNSKNVWLVGQVMNVFHSDTIADGYSVTAGTVKVSSTAGVKWVLPEAVPTQLRKAPMMAAGGGYGGSSASGARAPAATPTPTAAPSTGGTMPAQAYLPRGSSSSSSVQLCKSGCGRPVQPGLTRGLKPYDTCCKACARKPGSDEHDENCGGQRLSGGPTIPLDPSDTLKSRLERMLRNSGELQTHVDNVFAKAGGGSDRLSKQQVSQGLQYLIELFGVKLDVVDNYLNDMCSKYGSNPESLTRPEFTSFCRAVLQDRQGLWFPTTLPVKTTTFVKQNRLPLDRVYTMGARVGEGSFGTVYQVTHKISGESRVCKKIKKSKSDMTTPQILKEIEAMAMLDHPNVIKVYEYFDDAEYVSQIMEPCNGGELQDKVDVLRKTRRPPYDEAFMCDVIKQTLRALAFMHNIPFLHKDLKPQNIMMVDRESSSIKVIDFGLAELFNKDQKYAALAGGTLLYMAPEVFQQKMTVKVDVWSTGVILYNLCTGDFPYIAQWPPPDGRDEAWWQEQTIEKIKNDTMKDHPLLQKVSPLCLDMLRRMLERDDSKRPDASQCLEHAWFSQGTQIAPTLSVGVVQCVEAYARMSELKKAVFLLIAHQCEVPALFELRALFTHFDTKNRGSLSTEDLRQVFAASGMGPLTAERVIHALDRNGDSYVNWTEFTAAAICVSVCRQTRVVDAAFATFDTDLDGQIAAEDVESVIADDAHRALWRSKLPDLFKEMAETPSASWVASLKSLTRGFAKAEQRASKDQFRQYIGQKMDFRAGDALYAVT